MRALLVPFPPEEAIVIALTRRGSRRIIRTEDATIFCRLVKRFGARRAWEAAARSGMFFHMDRPILPGVSFDISEMSDSMCRSRFRFDHFGVQQLIILMKIPSVIIVPGHRDRISHIEALCLVLDRMAYPRKWSDLESVYNRHRSSLSRIFKFMLHKILQSARHRLLASSTTTEGRLSNYATAFWNRHVPRSLQIWAIVDVKKVKTCRPITGQRSMYSGHKKIHCFKFQTLQAPDGLIVHCSQSLSGRHGDGHILQESNLLEWVRARPELQGYFIFGDSAYPVSDVMLSMYRGRNLSPEKKMFNHIMSSVRVGVEWGYDVVVKAFSITDWWKQMKILHVPVEAIWHLSVFFTNCRTCHFHGNVVSDYFRCPPPSLEEYLANFPNHWLD